ncbi:argininosuccinate lyase [Candidatus Woesearchaeota archaeon]|nr:argininosuccinate lyase [Candidatus Woesearchaeota archaeon]
MKLWTDCDVNAEVDRFVLSGETALDQKLLKYDVIASMAHAEMLEKTGILTAGENKKLQQALESILELDENGEFLIKPEEEDSHTAIENYLIEKTGDAGRKIHTARSRNDQALAAERLYVREGLEKIISSSKRLIEVLDKTSRKYNGIPMPGYTHMRKAMPSAVSMWLDSLKEALQDDIVMIKSAKKMINQNPLGTGAGYGVPMKVDRELTRRLLGFEKTQQNPIYVQNSRGKFELLMLHSLEQVMIDISKMATDMLVFSTEEFGYISLPEEICHGSSMMPQKKNPDVLEIMRAKAAIFSSYGSQIAALITNLPSGYSANFRLTKEPLIKGLETAEECIRVMAIVADCIEVNEKRCRDAMTPELFATEKAYRLVETGMPFRKAYRNVKKNLK